MLTSDEPRIQVKQIFALLDIRPDYKPFSLCINCNRPLVEITRESAEKEVPRYVYRTQRSFYRCQGCGRVYWRGTHWQAMKRLLDEWNRFVD